MGFHSRDRSSLKKQVIDCENITFLLNVFFLSEQKGASPLVYASIFAIYELVMLVTSFVFGNLVESFKPNRMSGFGLITTGLATFLFGFLTFFDKFAYFVMGSFAMRIVESLGATAFATSSYSFISACFPDQIATMFATLEMFFGLGVITGPVVGGFLYDWGGFAAPFISVGSIMLLFGGILVLSPTERLFTKGKLNGNNRLTAHDMNSELNSEENHAEGCNLVGAINDDSQQVLDSQAPSTNSERLTSSDNSTSQTLFNFLWSSITFIDAFIIITAITLMGFNGATLEPFIRHKNISDNTIHISLMFVALGSSYAFTTFFWGKVCDLYPKHMLFFAIFGGIFTLAGLALIGPIPALVSAFEPTLLSISGCLVLFGIGTAAKQVVGYTHVLNFTIQKRQFPASQQTYGYISGLFFSCLSFGGFIGPIIAGLTIEMWGYNFATFILFCFECFVFFILIVLQFGCSSFKLNN